VRRTYLAQAVVKKLKRRSVWRLPRPSTAAKVRSLRSVVLPIRLRHECQTWTLTKSTMAKLIGFYRADPPTSSVPPTNSVLELEIPGAVREDSPHGGSVLPQGYVARHVSYRPPAARGGLATWCERQPVAGHLKLSLGHPRSDSRRPRHGHHATARYLQRS